MLENTYLEIDGTGNKISRMQTLLKATGDRI
jgi:hypothetical protein